VLKRNQRPPVCKGEPWRRRITIDRDHDDAPLPRRPQQSELLASRAEDEQLAVGLHSGIVAGARDGARDVVQKGYAAPYAGGDPPASGRRDGIASAATAPMPTTSAPTQTAGCMPSTKCCGRP